MLKTLKKTGLIILKVIKWALIVMFGIVIYEYLTCPVYDFPEPKAFSGNLLYNPYKGIDSNYWRRANFQVQSYAWGGITDGRKNSNRAIDSIYSSLGYSIIATSDYQKINRWGDERPSYIPVYEHGYGIFKNHQVLVGSEKVDWREYPFFQNLENKQNIINVLRKHNKLIYIAHPKLRGAYSPDDMKYLTGYDGIEVLNYMRVSIVHWDSALSAGHYVTAIGDDDSHDISRPMEVGYRCTYIYSPVLTGDSIVQALRTGRAFAAEIYRTSDETYAQKIAKVKFIAKLDKVELSGDTLRVAVNKPASKFRFIGQGGKVLKEISNTDSASYIIKPADTYVRTEIYFPNKNIFYLNPIIRYDGTTPSNAQPAKINYVASWIFWILSWLMLAFIIFAFFYLKNKKYRKTKGNSRS